MVDIMTLREGDKLLVEATVKYAPSKGSESVSIIIGGRTYSPVSIEPAFIAKIKEYAFEPGDTIDAGKYGCGVVKYVDDEIVLFRDNSDVSHIVYRNECTRTKAADDVAS
jgi:hypothetical protein